MAYIQSYKELKVWQKADELAVRVYKLTSNFPREYLYDLTNQLRRAVLSVPTNLAEGCASPHSGELLQYINIANRSLSETRYLLEFAHKIGLIKAADISELDGICLEVSRMLKSLNLSIKQKKVNTSSK
jgi:four helix bundle protein